MSIEDWFLAGTERGNDGTQLDRRRGDGTAWTENNEVRVCIDGAAYFARLHAVIVGLRAGDSVWFTDWEGHADERLVGEGTEGGPLLTALAAEGVEVRGLLWRSHPRQAHFAEQDNMRLAREVNQRGGLLVLDERVRRGGSHHQKMVIIHQAPDSDPGSGREGLVTDVAFVGGIDLCHGRHDDPAHMGDPQAIQLDRRYGTRPPWHDAQLEIRGAAVEDLAWSFRERWNDPSPLDHRNPVRALLRRRNSQPRTS